MKIAGIITMLVSLLISIVSGYCTVVGMGKVFASAAYVTMFIASVIEIGRVVLIYDLHHYWHELKLFQKIPGICMLLISITLSAMGIFGFMSNAHSQRTQEVIPIEMEIKEKHQQINILEQSINVNNEQLKQFDGKAFEKYTEMGYVTKAVNLQKEQQKVTNKLYDDNRQKQEEITKLNQEILQLQLNAEKKAPTLAHLKYYAKLFNVDNDTAIIIFIVMIMLVFDTLAMYLMITADWINNQGRVENIWAKKEEILDKISEEDIANKLNQLQSIIDNYQKQLLTNDVNYDEQFNHLASLVDSLPEKIKQEPISFDKIEEKLDKLLINDNEKGEELGEYLDVAISKINDYNESVASVLKDNILAINNTIGGLKDNILAIDKTVDIEPLKELIKNEFQKFEINHNQSDLIYKLDEISEKINQNNIDSESENGVFLNKITASIDNNEDVINSERFLNMINENPKILEKLKKLYKRVPSVLEKLNNI